MWDGQYVKSLPIYIQHHGNLLGIQLYMVEVELVNPLGSKKGKHKVSVFYWTLMNLPPKFRSSLRSIMLLGVLSSDLLKQRGTAIFLKSFVSDLILLRDGVILTVRNESLKWYGILLHFVGDIPASNFIAEFKEGVGAANLPCRSCMIIRNDLETIHLESDCILRDKISHEAQVSQIECAENQTAAQKDSISTRFGVNCRCIFTILEYFDATKCFMHDLIHVSNDGMYPTKEF